METSHNGTDMFHETGAKGAAINKLLAKADQLKIEKSVKRVRMGRVRTKCGPVVQQISAAAQALRDQGAGVLLDAF